VGVGVCGHTWFTEMGTLTTVPRSLSCSTVKLDPPMLRTCENRQQNIATLDSPTIGLQRSTITDRSMTESDRSM